MVRITSTEGNNKRNDRYREHAGIMRSQKSFGSSRCTSDTTSTNSSSIGLRSGTYRESTAKRFICDCTGSWLDTLSSEKGRTRLFSLWF